MVCDVESLFHCFVNFFDKIIFFDATANIQDTVYVKDDNGEYNTEEYWDFVKQYAYYDVTEWQYVGNGNYIDLTIAR